MVSNLTLPNSKSKARDANHWVDQLAETKQVESMLRMYLIASCEPAIYCESSMGRKLTLKSVHRGCSESSLLGIVRNQLCHPSFTVKDNISHSFHHVSCKIKMPKRTHAIVNGTALPPIEDKI
jgi:hypothetical protein